MPTQPTGPDVRQLNDQELAKSEFPGGRDQSFRVFIDPTTHAAIWAHSQADTNVEICGVLVGQWAKDEKGPFLMVTASIRGEAAAKKFAEVTFTHETWSAINTEMDSKYADKAIVGWYHTHPDFGIFLSDRDRFIQENFFSGPGQVALVVDPIRKIEGVFVWQQGKPDLTQHYWVGNRLIVGGGGNEEHSPQTKSSPASTGATTAATVATPAPSDWLSFVQKLLTYVLVFLVGWLLAGRLNDALLDQARQEGVAFAVYQFGLRPDLDIRLSELQSDLLGIGNTSQQLAQDHQQRLSTIKDLSPEDLEKLATAWKEIQMRLQRSMALVNRVHQDYCLDNEQQALVKQIVEAQVARSRKEEAKSKSSATKPTTSPKTETPKREDVKPREAEKKSSTSDSKDPDKPASAAAPDAKPSAAAGSAAPAEE